MEHRKDDMKKTPPRRPPPPSPVSAVHQVAQVRRRGTESAPAPTEKSQGESQAAPASPPSLRKLAESWKTKHQIAVDETARELVSKNATPLERAIAELVGHELVLSRRLAGLEITLIEQASLFAETAQVRHLGTMTGQLKDVLSLRNHGSRRLMEFTHLLATLEARRRQHGRAGHLRVVG